MYSEFVNALSVSRSFIQRVVLCGWYCFYCCQINANNTYCSPVTPFSTTYSAHIHTPKLNGKCTCNCNNTIRQNNGAFSFALLSVVLLAREQKQLKKKLCEKVKLIGLLPVATSIVLVVMVATIVDFFFCLLSFSSFSTFSFPSHSSYNLQRHTG